MRSSDEHHINSRADELGSTETRILYAYVTDDANIMEDTDDNTTTSSMMQPPIKIHRTRWLILELPVFLVFVASYLSDAVYQNQILYQSCITVFHYNSTECQPLLGVERETALSQRIEAEVQPYVARIFMTRSLFQSIIPAFVSLFIGPWSDKFGRRPIILTTFTGYFVGFLILTILAFISTKVAMSPWLFLLSSIPAVLSGGTCALITGIYCYISDVAKEKARAVRMVVNEAAMYAGIMVGSLSSGFIYAATNAVSVFALSTTLMLLALLYAYFYVSESLNTEYLSEESRLREFFRVDLVKDSICTCFKRRPNFDRSIIWLTIISLVIGIFTMDGESNVMYLFLRMKFDWTLEDYNLFTTVSVAIQIIGSIFGIIILRRVLKLSIISVSIISLGCSVLESTVRATAVHWWEMYFGIAIGFMRGLFNPMARAIQSHVAPSTEVGKIFAITTSLESLSPLVGAPLYTNVYDATINNYPGAFNFISGGLFLVCFILITTIFGIQKSLGPTVAYEAISS